MKSRVCAENIVKHPIGPNIYFFSCIKYISKLSVKSGSLIIIKEIFLDSFRNKNNLYLNRDNPLESWSQLDFVKYGLYLHCGRQLNCKGLIIYGLNLLENQIQVWFKYIFIGNTRVASSQSCKIWGYMILIKMFAYSFLILFSIF